MTPSLVQSSSFQLKDDSSVSKIDRTAHTQHFLWQSCVTSIKESLVSHLVYFAHDVNAFLDTSESGMIESGSCATFQDPKKLAVAADKRALVNTAVIAPFSAAIPQEPRFTAAAQASDAGVYATCHEGLAMCREMSEHHAATTIQRMIRKRASAAGAAIIKSGNAAVEQKLVQASKQGVGEFASVFRTFSRAGQALRGLFSAEAIADDRQNQAARQIQRAWRRYESRSKPLEASLPALATIAPVESSSPSLPLFKRKRTRNEFSVEDEPEQDTALDSNVYDELAELAARNENEGSEAEYVFVVKRCDSVPLPVIAVRPIALKSRLLVARLKAACVIQSAWRCVLARLHSVASRRSTAFALEYENMMPEVRSQMKLVHQRSNELRDRSSSGVQEQPDVVVGDDDGDDWL